MGGTKEAGRHGGSIVRVSEAGWLPAAGGEQRTARQGKMGSGGDS